MTESQFQAGFKSTRDADVLVTGITAAPGGRPAADVTFTAGSSRGTGRRASPARTGT